MLAFLLDDYLQLKVSRRDRFFRIKSDQGIRPWGRELFFGSKTLVCLEPHVFFHEECSAAYSKEWLVRWYEPINRPCYLDLDIKELPSCLGPMYPSTLSPTIMFQRYVGSLPRRFRWSMVIWHRDYLPLCGRNPVSGLRWKQISSPSCYSKRPKKGREKKQLPVGDFLQLPPWTWKTCFLEKSFQRNGYFWYLLITYWSIISGVRSPPLKNSRSPTIFNPYPSRMVQQEAAIQVLWRHSWREFAPWK